MTMTWASDPIARLRRARMNPFGTPELAVGFIFLVVMAFLIIFRDFVQTYDPMQGNLLNRFKPPGTEGHWLGTDNLGRDQWSRMLAGLVWSMSCALMANLISFAIGVVLGLLAAEKEGWTRTTILQAVMTVQSFPGLVIAICVITVVGQGYWPLVLTLGLLGWTVFTRVVFAEAQSLMKREYVVAAQLAGASRWSILWGHVLPGLRATLMVMFAFQFAGKLIAESALSFLGIGAPLGVPTWGNMLAESRQYLFNAPWMLFVPAGAIVVAVLTMNFIGDGIAVMARKRGRAVDV
jgi:peptide/nickel transport system permease protein